MFSDEPSQPPQEADDASVSISIDSQAEGEQCKRGRLIEAAHHLADAIQTEELRDELDGIAADCSDLRARITADLQQARTKITEAILDVRRGIAPAIGAIAGDIITSQVEKAAGFADRIVAGRTDNSAEASPRR